MTHPAPRAVVLLSGGVDSTTTLALAAGQGLELYALTFRYGQRHEAEIDAARRVARAFRVAQHEIVAFDLRRFGGSALTDDIAVPKDRAPRDMAHGIPVTYVPARNTIFLSFALAWAEVLGASDIFLGVNALDYSGYPDCRPEYITAFQALADLATKSGVEGRQRLRLDGVNDVVRDPGRETLAEGPLVAIGPEIDLERAGLEAALARRVFDDHAPEIGLAGAGADRGELGGREGHALHVGCGKRFGPEVFPRRRGVRGTRQRAARGQPGLFSGHRSAHGVSFFLT